MAIFLEKFKNAKLLGLGGLEGNDFILYQNGKEARRIGGVKVDAAKAFYAGANEAFWGPAHEMGEWAIRRDGDLELYDEVNRSMSARILSLMSGEEFAYVHGNDYHWMRVYPHLRERFTGKLLLASHFAHTPWPRLETVPAECRSFIDAGIEGMLHADFCGFHTNRWLSNFVGYVHDGFDGKYRIDESGDLITIHSPNGHYSQLVVQPLGLRLGRWELLATGELNYMKFRGMNLILGVERNDFTKCVQQRFKAIRLFFQQHPEEIGRTVFFQVAAPTRQDIDAFKTVWQLCEQEEAKLLEEFSAPDSAPEWVPVYWEKKLGGLPPEELGPLYRLARVLTVNPNMDGLNLVAKEGPFCWNPQNPGVLCLSRGAGVWDEIGEHAVELVPSDPQQMADAIHSALHMSLKERQRRSTALKHIIRANPIEDWVDVFYNLSLSKAYQLRQKLIR
jgi:trehalose-6-phosphate synthase